MIVGTLRGSLNLLRYCDGTHFFTSALPQLVSDYGYLAVFIGTSLEGEAILLLAAYAAHQGYLSLPLVIGVAFCGATLGDQIFFLRATSLVARC